MSKREGEQEVEGTGIDLIIIINSPFGEHPYRYPFALAILFLIALNLK